MIITLVVDYFGIEHAGQEYTQHFIETLQGYYKITTNWEENKFLGIYLQWNQNNHTVCLLMKNYAK